MQRVTQEDYRRNVPQRQATTTSDQDEWEGVPYKPNPYCSDCKGAGFLHPRYPDGVVNYRGCVPCRCLLDSIHGKQPQLLQTFENFNIVPGTEKAFKAAKALAYGEAKFIWLLIHGDPGNGKTHLCNAIVKVTRERGVNVRMVLAADLFAMLREGIEGHQTDLMMRRYKDIDFLAIDDYGVEYGSDWEAAKFDEIMTSRYATAKPTVLITNKDLKELPERVQSRFMDKVMARAIHNSAGDYRSRRSYKT